MAHPNDRLTIEASASLHDTDQDMDVHEKSQGVDFTDTPFSTNVSGDDDIDRDAELVDFDVSYLITDRVALLTGLRYQHLDQDGDLAFGTDRGDSHWDVETWGGDAGLEVQVLPELTLSGGISHEMRDADSSWEYDGTTNKEDEETKHTGYFLNVGWRPVREFRVMAGFEDSTYDDPYTLSSPTDRQMYRIRAQYGGGEGFSVSGSYRFAYNENNESDWESKYHTANLRMGYRMAGFSASVGYSYIDIERDIDQQVDAEGTLFFVPIDYDAESDFVDGRFVWSFVEHWKVGGGFRFYQNDGSVSLDRLDLRTYVEREIGQHYLAHLGYRFVDYDEDPHDDNYEADIVEIAIGYHW
jgi:hypothetical protein